jgi:hypothetical protein
VGLVAVAAAVSVLALLRLRIEEPGSTRDADAKSSTAAPPVDLDALRAAGM